MPIDYGVQGGPTLTLGVVRVPATEPSERIGALLLLDRFERDVVEVWNDQEIRARRARYRWSV